MVERQTGFLIKTIVTDGGWEYTSNEFDEFYELEGIVHDVASPHHSTLNIRCLADSLTAHCYKILLSLPF